MMCNGTRAISSIIINLRCFIKKQRKARKEMERKTACENNQKGPFKSTLMKD
jgi:hypothetical protein